jgi:hypothetical protein
MANGRGIGLPPECIEEPEYIRPALQRAWRKVEEVMVGFVNVRPTTAPARRRSAFPAAKPDPTLPPSPACAGLSGESQA